jgi:hypothetical protein
MGNISRLMTSCYNPSSWHTQTILAVILDIFSLCVAAEQYVAPINSRPVVPPITRSHPHRARHASQPPPPPPNRGQSSRDLWSVDKYLCPRISLHTNVRQQIGLTFYEAMVSTFGKVINRLQFLIYYRSPPRLLIYSCGRNTRTI